MLEAFRINSTVACTIVVSHGKMRASTHSSFISVSLSLSLSSPLDEHAWRIRWSTIQQHFRKGRQFSASTQHTHHSKRKQTAETKRKYKMLTHHCSGRDYGRGYLLSVSWRGGGGGRTLNSLPFPVYVPFSLRTPSYNDLDMDGRMGSLVVVDIVDSLPNRIKIMK